MAKVSKNSKAAQRAASGGTGKDYVKVVKPIKNAVTGKYSYKTVIVHKDTVSDFFKDKK